MNGKVEHSLRTTTFEAIVRRRGTFGIVLAAVVVVGKLTWLLWVGPSYEIDTGTYLGELITYHHPPLYGLFLQGLERLGADAWGVATVQSLLLAAAGGLACLRFGRGPLDSLILAVALALEPASSFFAANLMSEALFLPLLLVWLVLLADYRRAAGSPAVYRLLVGLAATGAALNSVRLAALILPGWFLVVAASRRAGLLRALGHMLLMLVATEALLVPAKLVYLERYGSYSMSLFSAVNLWNNACVLYPDSSIRQAPETEFERFLAGRGVEEFTTANALDGNTIHESYSGYHQFVTSRRLTLDEQKAFADRLGRSATRLILENPAGYLMRFLLPNFLKPLVTSEEIPWSARVDRLLERRLGYVQDHPVRYSAWWWRVWMALLVAATATHLWRRSGDGDAFVLLGFAWYYVLVLPLLAASFLRYVLVLAPVILIGAWRAVPSRSGPGARVRSA